MSTYPARICTRCGAHRGTNPDCPKCRARRAAENVRMDRRRGDDRARGLCAGGCGDVPDSGFDSCAVCRGKGRQRRRLHRLRMII